MANCSFITGPEARNIARNNTLIWEEICQVQTQILAGIDANVYSIIVNDGTPFTSTSSILSVAVTSGGAGYTALSATAVINSNGTSGAGATVTPIVTGTTISGFTIDTAGSGYVPVNVTAAVAASYNLNDGQDETNYDGLTGDGTFVTGGTGVNAQFGYAAAEVITLSENSTVTVDTVTDAGQRVLIAGQIDTDYNGVGSNGGFAGGTGYVAADIITLTDGTLITVTTAPSGIITEFVITSSSTNSTVSLTARSQLSTSGNGTSFTLTSDTNNEAVVGVVATFDVASAGADPFVLGGQISQGSSSGIGAGFALAPTTNNSTVIAHAGAVSVLTPIESAGSIISVAINTPGTSYILGQIIAFTHPAGSGASASVSTIDGSGGITGITLTNGGSGYEQSVATITVTAPGGATPALAFAGTVITTTAASANDYTNLAFDSAGPYTITQTGGTGFVTDQFVSGSKIEVSSAEDVTNNGIYTISSVTESAITVAEAIAVTNATDTAALISKTGVVSGISIQEGGVGYVDLYPTVTVSDTTGSGATFSTNIAGGLLTAVNVITGGSAYSQTPTPTILNSDGSVNNSAVLAFTVGTNTWGTDPTEYHDVLAGLDSDAVISDQIQYVLDYFTSLGYNIRAQTNSTTTNTMQWQIIW
jgi:hypothetical protein